MSAVPRVEDFARVVTVPGQQCPSCGESRIRVFYEALQVPTHSVRLMRTREQAVNCRKGDLRLAFCRTCGFIWNCAFEPALVSYGDDYESTQAFSPTFNVFHERLARQLFERYDLADKEVFEIGCGQEAEFLQLLAGLGVKRAVGFDPTLRETQAPGNVTLIKDWYSEAYADRRPDFVASKMTMEHIPDPGRFLGMLRRAIGDRPEAIAFAMMPEVRRILEVRAFWDIYYEHCAYFTLGSLARAFRRARFDVFDLHTDFGDQYCLIAARPGDGRSAPLDQEETPEELATIVDDFALDIERRRARWRAWLRDQREQGRRTVLWGAGSKAVAFLTTLGVRDEVEFAVDINPRRRHTYMTGSGHAIDTPERLARDRPDNVIIMSPIYVDEITADLARMQIAPNVLSIEDLPPETR
jgi:hypothetical protein